MSEEEIQRDQFTVTIDDLVASTVRALSMRDADRLSAKEIDKLIPPFAGTSGEDPRLWFERIDKVKSRFNVPADKLLLTVVSKLSGKALEWYQSKHEYIDLGLDELRCEMLALFHIKEDSISLRKMLERRRWKKDEAFSTYFMDKVTLGNKLNIAEQDMISYIIDGLDNPGLQAMAKLRDFASLNELLIKMNEISTQERFAGRADHSNTQPRNQRTGHNVAQQETKCYNCNSFGHVARECTKPRREPGSCFECGSKDHRIRDCPQKRRRTMGEQGST